jgi:hypothetical protein
MDIEIVDITTDVDLFERYRYEIPVVAVESGGTVAGRITAEDLRRILHLGPEKPRASSPAYPVPGTSSEPLGR